MMYALSTLDPVFYFGNRLCHCSDFNSKQSLRNPNKCLCFFPHRCVKTSTGQPKNFCFYEKGLIIAVE